MQYWHNITSSFRWRFPAGSIQIYCDYGIVKAIFFGPDPPVAGAFGPWAYTQSLLEYLKLNHPALEMGEVWCISTSCFFSNSKDEVFFEDDDGLDFADIGIPDGMYKTL